MIYRVDSSHYIVIESRSMRRQLLKSKIHRVIVTDADVDYEGSITIDAGLMDAADIREGEKVHVWDVTNGNRLVTYAIEGELNSGIIAMNGAAALLVKKGDTVIIATYADYDEQELKDFHIKRVFVDGFNKLIKC